MFLDPPLLFFINKRSWRIGSHAAGIRPQVAIESGLVILRWRKCHDRTAVRDRKQTDFQAIKPFLDDQARSGCLAELTLDRDAIDGRQNFPPCGTDNHTFAPRQTVGLHDKAAVVFFPRIAIVDEVLSAFGIAKHLVVGSGNVGVAEKFFTKNLTPFELCGRLARAEDAEFFLGKESARPATSGPSGPTTVRPISFCLANFTKAGKSWESMSTFSASIAVPALPGATNTCVTRLLWANFQASACLAPRCRQ